MVRLGGAGPEVTQRIRQQAFKGATRPFFAKPFPNRCAIEIGSGGMVTALIAQVDANQNAIREEQMFHQVPVRIKLRSGLPILEEESWQSVDRAMTQMMENVRRRCVGISEFSGLLSWPLNALENTEQLRIELSRKYKVDFSLAPQGEDKEQLDRLAFDSYTAAAKSLNKYQVVALHESLKARGLAVGGAQGMDLLALRSVPGEDDLAPGQEYRKWSSAAEARDELQRFSVPIGTLHAHRLLITEIQKRMEEHYTIRTSPNPVLRQEMIDARNVLSTMIGSMLPPWVHEKSDAGCLFVCSSSNGGLFNTAARVAGRLDFSLEALEVRGEHHYCGLTDVLIGENYLNPHLIVPQIILASSVMRALKTIRMTYIPNVHLTYGMIVNPKYWLYHRREQLEEELRSGGAWYQKQRSWPVPHQARNKFIPNVPHDAGPMFEVY